MDFRRVPGGAIAARLLAESRIDALQAELALSHAERMEDSLLDALIDCHVISEEDLLKYMAKMFRTQFVSTEKLSRASVAQNILARVPVRTAEKLGVFPILYDARTDTLSVVTASTDDLDLDREVKMCSSVQRVRMLLARPAAVKAAICKHYHGDPHAFVTLRERISDVSHRGIGQNFEVQSFGDDVLGEGPSSPGRIVGPLSEPASWGSRKSKPVSAVPRIALPHIELPKPSKRAPDVNADTGLAGLPLAAAAPPTDTPARETNGHIEILNVMVSLLERTRHGLKGHSTKVSELCGALGRRLSFSSPDIAALRTAALIHDLGKSHDQHFVPLYIAEHPAYREAAQTVYRGPIELFASVALPPATIAAIEHVYERFDGDGFPKRLKGDEIPIASRVLALVESYVELVANSHNAYGRMLSASEALDRLQQGVGKVFDPKLFEIFQVVALGDGLRSTLRPPRGRVLLIDPNLDHIAPLELRFIEHGYSVDIADDAQVAVQLIGSHDYGLIISEVSLSGMGGFELLSQTRRLKGDVPWIFLTAQADRQNISKGFECGASDYLIKPTSVEVIVTKAQQMMENYQQAQPAHGMKGSLNQMAVPEIVQVFSHGRKSGKLRIDSDGKTAEVHFINGNIVDAQYGALSGEQAFYAMLNLTDGQFFVDPTFVATRRVINASAEALLLEGMRRLDESQRQ